MLRTERKRKRKTKTKTKRKRKTKTKKITHKFVRSLRVCFTTRKQTQVHFYLQQKHVDGHVQGAQEGRLGRCRKILPVKSYSRPSKAKQNDAVQSKHTKKKGNKINEEMEWKWK